MLYDDGIDLKKISETHKLSGASFININKDGTSTDQLYGEIVTTVYECPCGNGTICLTQEEIPGYNDWYTKVNCADCYEKYEILWGKGVIPGHSPMVRKKISTR